MIKMALSDTILLAEEEEKDKGTDSSGSGDRFNNTEFTVLSVVFLLTGLLMLVGYIWVVVTVTRTRRLHTASDTFLASLAVTEIVVVVCSLPVIFTLNIFSEFSFASVIFMSWGTLLSVFGYFLNAVLVAADKWFRVSRPFVYAREVTPARCTVCLAGVWGLSTAGSLAGAAAHTLCLMEDFSGDAVFSSFYTLAIIFSYVIILPCVLTITVFNILIVRIARHHARAIAADIPAAPREIIEDPGPPSEHRMQPADNQPHLLGPVHRKSTRQFTIFFLSFFLAWTPMVVTIPIVHYTSADEIRYFRVVYLIGLSFVLFKAVFGTLILTLLQREYRDVLKGNLRGIGEKLRCVRRR